MDTQQLIYTGVVMAATGGYYVWKLRGATGYNAAAPQEHPLKAVRAELAEGNFLPLAGLLAHHANDLDNLCLYVEQCVAEAPIDALRNWQRVAPSSSLPHLALGARLIEAAWEARGSGPSSTVTASGFRQHEALCREADQNLQRAAELAPDDPSPWALRLTAGIPLDEVTREVEDEVFQAATARCPTHYRAHLSYGRLRSRRWGGSDAAFLAFARDAYRRAGAGSMLAALIAEVHDNIATYPLHFENDPEAERAYRARAEVQREVAEAFEASVGRPDTPRSKVAIDALNRFARWFYACDDKPRGRRCVAAIDGAFDDRWHVGGAPARVLKQWLSQS